MSDKFISKSGDGRILRDETVPPDTEYDILTSRVFDIFSDTLCAIAVGKTDEENGKLANICIEFSGCLRLSNSSPGAYEYALYLVNEYITDNNDRTEAIELLDKIKALPELELI